jgi:hypothetical protein
MAPQLLGRSRAEEVAVHATALLEKAATAESS